MLAAFAVLVVACVVGIPLWNAALHYSRGAEALEDRQYNQAAGEFAAARFLGLTYRDAKLLEGKARRAAIEEAYLVFRRETEAPLIALLEKARAGLDANDYVRVLTTLRSVDANELETALDTSVAVRKAADDLDGELTAAAQTALRNRSWRRAENLAAAVLLFEQSNALATKLQSEAKLGRELTRSLEKAKGAARRGQWRAVLRTALAVLAGKKDFPGAAALAADARAALAPKPKAAATAASPEESGGSVTAVPAAPAAPQPPPP